MINRYSQLEKLIKSVDSTATELAAPDVPSFLTSVMAGTDPRDIDSELYTLVKRIVFREFTGGSPQPDSDEWTQIVNIVLNSGRYQKSPVDINQSQAAANKLMDFLHAKMKALEITGDMNVKVEIEPLTGKALDEFKSRFDDEF